MVWGHVFWLDIMLVHESVHELFGRIAVITVSLVICMAPYMKVSRCFLIEYLPCLRRKRQLSPEGLRKKVMSLASVLRAWDPFIVGYGVG